MAKERKITIRGEQWRLLYSRKLKRNHGYCQPSKRLISIDHKLSGVMLADTLAHEITHCHLGLDIKEPLVDRPSTDIANLAMLSSPSKYKQLIEARLLAGYPFIEDATLTQLAKDIARALRTEPSLCRVPRTNQ